MTKIKGITSDSRQVKPGFVFVAVKGLHSDGHDFIPEAVKNGAVKIYGQKDLKIPNYQRVADSREKLGELASEFYGNPSRSLKVIGVTGTKGKTTTCHIIHHILTELGKKAGLVSTVTTQGFHTTTPDVISLNKELANMVKVGYEYAVIEVSSHGIEQGRVSGINFFVGVLTNVAPEHLDYHKTFKEYKRVKMSFVNSAKFKALAPLDTDLNILPGKFNNLNIEAAIKALEYVGIPRNESIAPVNTFKLPEGRLEEIKNDKGVKIVVDFAHTPDSLKAVLNHFGLQPHNKIITVFGCASERDPAKRSKMARISGQLSDISIFTVEDSRFENVYKIFKPMVQAVRRLGKLRDKDFYTVPERGEAIALALSLAKKGDIVGIYGKGHEKTLSYKGFEHPWSDKAAIENYLNKDDSVSAVILAAGKGSRMKSQLPKVLHEICGRPMIAYSLQNLRNSSVGEIISVLSFKRNLVARVVKGAVKIAVQENPKGGTGDAVRSALPFISDFAEYVMVFYGDDSAFFKPETIKQAVTNHIRDAATVSFASVVVENPFGLGRVMRDTNNKVIGIIEEKAATDKQKKICEINCGNFIFNKNWLIKNIHKLEKSASGEYYINNLVQAAIDQGKNVYAYRLKDRSEWQGINTPEELSKAREKMEKRLQSHV